METKVFGVDWADFCTSLRSGTITKPFLVRESGINEKSWWYLYGLAPGTLVQVMTFKKRKRAWRTVDGAIRELEREFEVLPALRLFASVDSVEFDD